MPDTHQLATGDSQSQKILRRLTICADDFGLAQGIDDGIVELARLGRLSAVSCLSLGPTLAANAARLGALPVDIGLHLNFTEPMGPPYSALYRPLQRLIPACYLRQLQKPALGVEIERQFEAFERTFGKIPDFVDGHQHVHQLPVIRDALLEVIVRRYPQKRLWLRSTQVSPVRRARTLKARIIAALGSNQLRILATKRGFSMNASLLGVYDFSATEEAYRQLLSGWLEAARDGDLLMCHPARAHESGDAIGPQRCREYAVLAQASFSGLLQDAGIEVLRLSQAYR